jgi:hypothetical protein
LDAQRRRAMWPEEDDGESVMIGGNRTVRERERETCAHGRVHLCRSAAPRAQHDHESCMTHTRVVLSFLFLSFEF